MWCSKPDLSRGAGVNRPHIRGLGTLFTQKGTDFAENISLPEEITEVSRFFDSRPDPADGKPIG